MFYFFLWYIIPYQVVLLAKRWLVELVNNKFHLFAHVRNGWRGSGIPVLRRNCPESAQRATLLSTLPKTNSCEFRIQRNFPKFVQTIENLDCGKTWSLITDWRQAALAASCKQRWLVTRCLGNEIHRRTYCRMYTVHSTVYRVAARYRSPRRQIM